MIKRFIYVFLFLSIQIQAQTKETLEKEIVKTLSYQHLRYKAGAQQSQINIYQIEFRNCTMSYPIFIKKGEKTERYTVRIFLSGISKIELKKHTEGYDVIAFTTNGKSIIKEYPNGTLVHEKIQIIPLKRYDARALNNFKKLKEICLKQ